MDKVLGHFEIIEKIADGGMGEVYRARDLRLDRDVALKFLPPDSETDPGRLHRLRIEARALASLQHPHIVTIHSIDEADGVPFITMEFIRGSRLDGAIPPAGIPRNDLLKWAIPLADALAEAHAHGILHRDFKPANIIVTATGTPKILDFGIARIQPRAEMQRSTGTATQEGVLLGTWPYMAPELIEGQDADARSDIFSFGVTLYQMATGTLPFQGATLAASIVATLRDTQEPVSALRRDLPASLSRLIDACLEKEPARRPESMRAVCDELEAIRRIAPHDLPLPSVAVLPFVDMSPEKDQAYFCEGIAEELINSLARIEGLRVASRTAVFMAREQARDVRDIGARLNVGAILEGSVRKAADRLRITVDLVSVEDGYNLWSERYDRKLEDVFAIQEEIARNTIQMLKVKLAPGEAAAPVRTSTANAIAYDYYLRGRTAFYQFRRRGIELALNMFSKAIQNDPGFARAYSGVADCCCFLFLSVDRRAESLRQAGEASRKALELAPDLPEAHASHGQVLSLSGRHAEAEKEFEAAIRLGPRIFEAYYLYARNSFARGDLEKAVRMYDMASEVNPHDYQCPLLASQIYEDMGRRSDAEERRLRGVRNAEERLRVFPDDIRALYMGANGLVGLGQIEKGIEWATLAAEMEPNEPMVLYNVACIYSMAGRTEAAIECLERGVRSGLTQKEWIEHDSNLDPLRSDPRFVELMNWLDKLLEASAPRD